MATQVNEIYKCNECGGIVAVVHAGADPVCCGKPMVNLKAGITDASKEKHVPVIQKEANGYTVVIGSVLHPMEEKHYIEWIELIADGKSYRQYLKPGEAPKAFFCVKAEKVFAREYCNLHGLWEATL